MEDVSAIKAMWDEWNALPFPSGYAGEEVAGIPVTLLDADAAACIHIFILNKGRLDDWHKSILKDCKKELEVVVENLDSEARTYFEKLLLMAGRVLKLVGR